MNAAPLTSSLPDSAPSRLRLGISEVTVLLGGALTSFVTALLLYAIEEFTGLSIFTLSIWVVIPVGAVISGAFAASGYYVAAGIVGHRPTRITLLGAVAVAGATHVGIYALQWATMTLPDGTRVMSALPFWDFLGLILGNQSYTFGHHGSGDGVSVGSFGYVLSGLQFLGFLGGGVYVWVVLGERPFCVTCHVYRKRAAKTESLFSSPEEFAAFEKTLTPLPPASKAYLSLVAKSPPPVKVGKGVVRMTHEVFACRRCSGEMLIRKIDVNNGRDWKDIDQQRWDLPYDTGAALQIRG